MANIEEKNLQTDKKTATELIAVANILGGLDVAEASSVAKITHSYARLTRLEGQPELDVTKFLRYKLLAPACDEINTALAAKVGVTKEALYKTLEKGEDKQAITKVNDILNSKEFAKELEPKLKDTLEKCRMVIDKGVTAKFFVSKDGKRYDADFCAIREAHKSIDGACPPGCPVAAATEVYNKPATAQSVKTNAK